MATRIEISKAKTLAELEALAKKYGYAFGWAKTIYNYRMNNKIRG